jgi:hypothetical protein
VEEEEEEEEEECAEDRPISILMIRLIVMGGKRRVRAHGVDDRSQGRKNTWVSDWMVLCTCKK